MSEGTKIQWADDTHNFWRGCTKVSPGCAHCYAEKNIGVKMNGIKWGKGAARVRSLNFDQPLRWNKRPWICEFCGKANALDGPNDFCECGALKAEHHRRRVFSLSLGDWLDEEVPVEWLAEMLDVIRRCPNLDFLLLTKRPENFKSRLVEAMRWIEDSDHPAMMDKTHLWILDWVTGDKIPQNIWFGFSAEDQTRFDERWAVARDIPAHQLFVSFEPLLGRIECPPDFFLHEPWGIWGGESGAGARPCGLGWLRSGVAQFKERACPVFVKQLGADVHDVPRHEGNDRVILLHDKKGGDMDEWPADLRVREFPNPPSREGARDAKSEMPSPDSRENSHSTCG